MNAPDPGPGYRLLKQGEILQNGDEYFHMGKWFKTEAAGKSLISGTHRRKVEDEDRWIPLKEQLPGSFPFWLGAAGKEPILVYSYHTDEQWTHWRPAHLPDPPEPQKSKEELGFDEWYAAHGKSLHHPFDAWLAALRWKEKLGSCYTSVLLLKDNLYE